MTAQRELRFPLNDAELLICKNNIRNLHTYNAAMHPAIETMRAFKGAMEMCDVLIGHINSLQADTRSDIEVAAIELVRRRTRWHHDQNNEAAFKFLGIAQQQLDEAVGDWLLLNTPADEEAAE